MTLDYWVIIARGLNDAASLAWFGLALAPAYGGKGFAWAQRIAGALSLISVAAIATLTMLNIVGPSALLDAPTAAAMLSGTSFGRIWLLRGGLCMVGVTFVSNWRVGVALSGLQLAALVFAGHAFARANVIGAASEAVHLLAVGAWVGGVLALALPRQDLLQGAGGFTKPGYVFAALAPVAGLALVALITGAPTPDVRTGYGQLAIAKICLFVVLLALAASNRFYALHRARLTALRVGIAAELGVMGALSLTAATLASTSPSM